MSRAQTRESARDLAAIETSTLDDLAERYGELQLALLTTDPLGLKAAGVAKDSVTRLLGIMANQQIPATTRGLREQRVGDNGLIFGSVDLTSPTATSGRAVA